jgi:hypothetical protein
VTSPRDARLAYALLKLKQSQISKALKVVEQFNDQEPGDKNAAKLGAARVGSVTMTDPTVKAMVADRALFLKWVQANREDQVYDVPTVREAYEQALLNELTDKRALIDGNGVEVAGVVFGVGQAPAQRFYPDDDAADLLDVVTPDDLPDIEGVDLAYVLGVRHDNPVFGGDVA